MTNPIPMPPRMKPGSSTVQCELVADAAHRPHRDRVQREPEREQCAHRHAAGQSPRERRREERDQRERQEAHAGLERRQPEDVLEVQRQVEEHREHRRRDRERRRLRADERRPAEQREVDHRRAVARLRREEHGERDHGDDEQHDDQAARPAVVVTFDQREDQGEQPDRERDHARRVEPAVLRIARLVQLAHAEDDRADPDRDVDEEDPAPREPRREHPAGERADRDGGADHRAPEAERRAALAPVELLREEGERGREHHRPADPLDAARDDQEERVVGEPARRRRDR